MPLNLADISSGSTPTPSLHLIGLPDSAGFVRELQQRLSFHGLYDPGAIDGSPGPLTDWAVGQFKIAAGTHDEGGIGPKTAAALLDTDSNRYFSLIGDGSDLAARIVRLLLHEGHWLCRHPECYNIIYLEGVDPDGTPNGNKPNMFNDLRTLISIEHGKPALRGAWEGSTEPGKIWTETPMNPKGAARIAFGQYYAWTVGTYHDQPALRQAAPITVYRDLNKDYKRDGDKTDTGMFAIHHHWGYDLPVSNMGNSGAGCLIGRTKVGHLKFIDLVTSDARAQASHGYRFTTAVMDGAKLEQPAAEAEASG